MTKRYAQTTPYEPAQGPDPFITPTWAELRDRSSEPTPKPSAWESLDQVVQDIVEGRRKA